MAQKIQVLLEDDLDGSEAIETVSFGLDGSVYEIDLNKKHADALRKVIGLYAEHARRTVPQRTARTRRTGRVAADVNPNDVRAWARSQGIEVKDRGRVPAELVVKFKAANA